MKKRIFASLLAICMLATSVFAAVPVFEDGFEADYADGLYISKPVLRAYGENLFAIGGFDTNPTGTTNATLGSSYDNAGGYIWGSTLCKYATYGGRSGGSVYQQAGGTPAERTVNIGIPVANIKADTIYELEIWVKNNSKLKDAEENAIPVPVPITATVNEKVYFNSADKSVDTVVVAAGLANPNGNQQLFGVTSGDDTYTRMAGRISINAEMLDRFKNNVDVHGQKYLPITLNIGFTKHGTAAATQTEIGYVWFDDISFREVLNAEVSTVDGQDGMPVYNDALIAGQSANIVFDAVNETGAAKDITLITAQYNADGSLNTVLDKQVVPVAETENRQHIVANITMPASVDGEIKIFAWDGTTLLTPYADAAGSEDTAYLTGSNRANTYMAGSKVWKTQPRANYGDNDGYAYTEEIVSNVSSEGVNSLYIPSKTRFTLTAENGSTSEVEGDTRVYAGFDTEVGKQYQLTFDYQITTYDTLAFALVGGAKDSTVVTSSMMSQPGTITTPCDLAGNLTTKVDASNYTAKEAQLGTSMIRFRTPGTVTTPWRQFTYTFTANAEKVWLYFGAEPVNGVLADNFALNGSNNAINASGGIRQRNVGAYVDNIKVVELAAE